MADVRMWTSKLGSKYPHETIQANDAVTQKELKRLRNLKSAGNDHCADCGSVDNSWASVTHGVFICIVCSDVHRSVGTHITKIKGCTGTYLWGPDEIEKMQTHGNGKAAVVYGDRKVSPTATKEEKQKYVIDKYEKRAFAKKPSERVIDLAKDQHMVAKPMQETYTSAKLAPAVRAGGPAVSLCTSLNHFSRNCEVPDSIFDDLFGDVDQPKSVPKVPLSSFKIAPTLECEIDLLA